VNAACFGSACCLGNEKRRAHWSRGAVPAKMKECKLRVLGGRCTFSAVAHFLRLHVMSGEEIKHPLQVQPCWTKTLLHGVHAHMG